MIGRHDKSGAPNIWTQLAEPVQTETGAPTIDDFRARLDAVVPGEWDVTLEPMPAIGIESHDVTFKARVQILGVIRESAGEPSATYRKAADSAFREACKLFGLGRETPPET